MLFFAVVVLILLAIMCYSVGCLRQQYPIYPKQSQRKLNVLGHTIATVSGIYVSWCMLVNYNRHMQALFVAVGTQKLLMLLTSILIYVMYK